MRLSSNLLVISFGTLLFFQCNRPAKEEVQENEQIKNKLEDYKEVRLTTDLSHLSEKQKAMIPKLIEVAKIMDELFWYEAYGDKDAFLTGLTEAEMRYAAINYGPWDRLNNNEPFLEGIKSKPEGANFYPVDMTKSEFDKVDLPGKQSAYTFLRRDAESELYVIPYFEMFSDQVKKASNILKECSELAEDEGFKQYLSLRADALLNDEYQASDMAWMDMKNNDIDFVVGPIENYEDKLFGYKAAHEAYLLIKDKEWSERLSQYAAYLPELQQGLPVPVEYKAEEPGSDADLNAYDVIYYAGDCNSGSKTIAINLPNDEQVQLEKGSRRLQLKNAMRAKFDEILVPISKVLISPEQQQFITFDAFFGNTMFHEVAHGLGIKNTIDGVGTVRAALKEHNSALEEGKADILGLYMITQLHEKGVIEVDLKEYYTTFMAGIFRSVRFGAASSHGKANMIRFNFFKEKEAFTKSEDGTYTVDYEKLQTAMNDLSKLILTLQGDGDYAGVDALVKEKGMISEELQSDLARLEEENIPVDIVFDQGIEVLGLSE
ncbi:Zn-dependent hydrolase [Marinoscillum sp. MHG1-6]|uniref:dipeptidyl-peptidase 3 family protein n=1 Tax=Marinoscillum sp. MHG1-6 TaxID=2959627 RepID=UPI00215770E8|nr:Zn-dependent hydrolase [Marinoscillum sp. MHG1-6]